jgi:hypothetical protein
MKYVRINNLAVKMTDEEYDVYIANITPEKTWQQKRIEAYGSYGDQLDMMYWDKVNGTTIWKDFIAEIKLRIPKE